MRVGVLVNQAGQVKRTYSIVTGEVSIPVEHGDRLIEFEAPHGIEEHESHEQRRQSAEDASHLQGVLPRLTTERDALQLHAGHLGDHPQHTQDERDAVQRHAARFAPLLHHRIHFDTLPGPEIEVLYHSGEGGKIVSRRQGSQETPKTPHKGRLNALSTSAIRVVVP